ncbi:hypothetical protein ACTMU2_18910 [Cupriavidus basilensis]
MERLPHVRQAKVKPGQGDDLYRAQRRREMLVYTAADFRGDFRSNGPRCRRRWKAT